MLAAAPVWVQALSGLSVGAGVLVLIGWFAVLARRGAWRSPVRGLPLSRVTPIHALLAFAAYFLSQSLAAGAVVSWAPPAEAEQIGSNAWHVLMFATDTAKCTAIVVVALIMFWGRIGWKSLTNNLTGAALVAVGGALAALPLATAQAEAARVLFEWAGHPIPEHPVIAALQEGGLSTAAVMQLVIGAIVIAPICEEVLFRGVAQDAAHNATGRFWPAAIASAILFGLVHFPQPHAIVPLTTLGIVLSVVRAQTGRLWPAILLHALFNGRTIALVLAGVKNA